MPVTTDERAKQSHDDVAVCARLFLQRGELFFLFFELRLRLGLQNTQHMSAHADMTSSAVIMTQHHVRAWHATHRLLQRRVQLRLHARSAVAMRILAHLRQLNHMRRG